MTLWSRLSAMLAALPVLAAACLAGGAPVHAASTPWLDHEHAQVRLLAASDTVGNDEEIYLALQFTLAPSWKIYWRSPGDAGFPPSLDWAGSANLAEAEIAWPVPHRFVLFDLQTFGYGGDVVLPIRAKLERPGEPAALRAQLTYLVCSEICVPHDGELALDLPAGPLSSAPEVFLIEQARAQVPGEGAEAGLAVESALLRGGTENPLLRVVARSDLPFEAPDVLVEGPPGFLFDAPEVELRDGGTRAELTVTTGRSALAKGVLEGKRLTLTVTDGERGLEYETVARHDRIAPLPTPMGGLLGIIALALLGGLILNLMPCVLPVLSIKLLSVVSHGGRDRGAVRVSFLASAAGILASFLVLAGIALALKAAGMAAGWGIQFQQPLFLSFMALIVTLFACNLWGLFEIPLPAWLGGLAQVGAGDHGHGHGLAGHFATGAFAALLATPCTAPFLGTAVGFALARGATEILLIFIALGLGLALPYLAVAALPGLATRLPRPGPWMVMLRRILGLALAGTAAWLLSVLAAQVGLSAALVVGALLLALGVVLFIGRRWSGGLRAASVAVLAVIVFAAPAGFPAGQTPLAETADNGDWLALDRAEIDRLVQDGQVVFVDVTADWCITCQVNKKLVIEQGDVAERLNNGAVTAMRGDWTLPSDEIADYLASFGRYGIPFNAVYGPSLPEGEALPELLTRKAVLDALDRAAGD
jgi:suppressor for copper-sensitivity B